MLNSEFTKSQEEKYPKLSTAKKVYLGSGDEIPETANVYPSKTYSSPWNRVYDPTTNTIYITPNSFFGGHGIQDVTGDFLVVGKSASIGKNIVERFSGKPSKWFFRIGNDKGWVRWGKGWNETIGRPNRRLGFGGRKSWVYGHINKSNLFKPRSWFQKADTNKLRSEIYRQLGPWKRQ